MIKAITIYDNEPFLRQISKEVDFKDPHLQQDIALIEEYCKENDVLAMASVQLGIPKRMIYLKNTNLDLIKKGQENALTEEEKRYNEARILINPVIITRKGLTRYWENCVSCVDNMGLVERPYSIEIEYFDINNTFHKEEFKGFISTVLSHEIDHLDGVLHMDIALKIKNMPQEERKKFRQTHGYEIISKNSKWQEKKN